MPAAAVIPAVSGLIGTGASIYGGLKAKSAADKQHQEQAQLYNQYLDRYTSGQGDFLKYLQGLGPQTSTSSSNTTGSSSTVSNPFVTEEFSPLVNSVKGILSQRLKGGGMPAGYSQSGIRAINDSYAGAEADISNAASKMNLAPGSLQSAMLGNPAARARAGAVADFRAETPLKARELQSQDMQMSQGLASIFGRGERSNTTSQSSTTGSQTGPAPIAPMSAFLPPGPQQGMQTGTSNAPIWAGGANDLMSLFGYLGGSGAFSKKPATGVTGGLNLPSWWDGPPPNMGQLNKP